MVVNFFRASIGWLGKDGRHVPDGPPAVTAQ
jgi:hypothetical protein